MNRKRSEARMSFEPNPIQHISGGPGGRDEKRANAESGTRKYGV